MVDSESYWLPQVCILKTQTRFVAAFVLITMMVFVVVLTLWSYSGTATWVQDIDTSISNLNQLYIYCLPPITYQLSVSLLYTSIMYLNW